LKQVIRKINALDQLKNSITNNAGNEKINNNLNKIEHEDNKELNSDLEG